MRGQQLKQNVKHYLEHFCKKRLLYESVNPKDGSYCQVYIFVDNNNPRVVAVSRSYYHDKDEGYAYAVYAKLFVHESDIPTVNITDDRGSGME